MSFAPTTNPVNIRGITNVLYIVSYSTIPGDLDPIFPSNVIDGVGSVIRKPANTNGHTLIIENNAIGSSLSIDSVVILPENVGQTILIKNSTNAYSQAINVPEVFIPALGTATAATLFPPNVPGLPSGFPVKTSTEAPSAPPSSADYDPIGNPTGGVYPYNYWQGHPFRDDTVVDINEGDFGIYEIIDVSIFADPLIMNTITLTRTEESINIVPGSIVYVKLGTLNSKKQFIFESNDKNFALGFSGLRNGISYSQTGLNIILTGTTAISPIGTTLNGTGTQFLSQLKIGDTITISPDPAPGGPFTITALTSNTSIEITPAFTAIVPLGSEIRITSGTQSVTTNYQLLTITVFNSQPGDPDDQITANAPLFTFGGTVRDLSLGDKVYIGFIGDPGVPTNVFTISTIVSPTIATVDSDITATLSVASQQIYKFVSSTLIIGRFTTFAADFTDGKFIIGDTVKINPGTLDEETLTIAGIINNDQLVATVVPSSDLHVCVPMDVVASSDIFINNFVADTPDPLVVNTIDAVNADICNLSVNSLTCPGGTATVDILAGAGVGTTVFTIGAGVSVSGISVALMTPLYIETYISNSMETYQLTNWVTSGFNAAGVPTSAPGVPGVYPDGSAVPPPPFLEIFSQDPTNTISFMGTNVGAVAPYTIVPSNNLLDIASITVDVAGFIETTTLRGDGITDLVVSGNGFDIDCDGDRLTNTTKLLLTGLTPCVDSDAAVTLIFGDTNATDFNFSNKNIDIGGAVGSILTDNIAGSTGAIIDFTTNTLIDILALTSTTINTVTLQNTTGALTIRTTGLADNILINTLGAGSDINLTTSDADINLTAVGVGRTIGLTTTGGNVTISAGGGSKIDMIGESVDMSGLASTITLTSASFVGLPTPIISLAFDGTGAPVALSASPFNVTSIARIGVTGEYLITSLGLSVALSNTTHICHIMASDSVAIPAAVSSLSANARITGATTIEVFITTSSTGARVDSNLIYLTVMIL